MKKLYQQDGVDVEEGDSFSAFAARICRASYQNSRFVQVRDFSRGSFRGPRGFTLKDLPEGFVLTVAPDGIGTKTVIIDAAQSHLNAARDVMAMTGGDITRWGGLPLVFSSVLDVNTLGKKGDSTNRAFREVILGLGTVAVEQEIVLLNGETAELGCCVYSEHIGAATKFNWAGFMVGVYHPKHLILGDTLKPGQWIVALKENGFRSNGLSVVRKALAMRFGDEWWDNAEAERAIQECATPSKIYDRLLTEANGWHGGERIPAHLIVHVTGGAIKSKLGGDILFPQGLSAKLDDLFEPPQLMKQCAEWRGMSDEEAYQTWNCGQGLLLVFEEDDAMRFISLASKHGLEARVCGEIEKTSEPSVTVWSKFGRGGIFAYRP